MNGKPVAKTFGNNSAFSSLSYNALNLGGSSVSSDFIGKFDEARLYNRVLSLAEIQQLYNFAPGPYAYYSFDEGSGSQVSDKSGNGFKLFQ